MEIAFTWEIWRDMGDMRDSKGISGKGNATVFTI